MMSYAILKGWSNGAAPDRVIIETIIWQIHAMIILQTEIATSAITRVSIGHLTVLWHFIERRYSSIQCCQKSRIPVWYIGNFSSQLSTANVNINMDIDRVYAKKDKSGMKMTAYLRPELRLIIR